MYFGEGGADAGVVCEVGGFAVEEVVDVVVEVLEAAHFGVVVVGGFLIVFDVSDGR